MAEEKIIPDRKVSVEPGDRVEVKIGEDKTESARVKGIIYNESREQWDILTTAGRCSEEDIINEQEFFPITSIHRDDLEAHGYDKDKITDEQMRILARKMANDYLNQLYHQSMGIIAESMGLPKKKEEN